MKKIIYSDQAPAPVGPYSQAVAANGILYVSGQIAIDPKSGAILLGDIQQETRQVMENMKAVLTEAGVGMDAVLKCTIFMADMNDYTAVNEIYAEYFEEDSAPAREAVQVARLPKDVNVEISCIALLG
jgi:2-iminobutanoate/2-iminopropanoate deaminase